MTPREAIVAHLPPFGARVRAQHVVDASGVKTALAWAILAEMCTERLVEVRDGWICRLPGSGWATDPYAAREAT